MFPMHAHISSLSLTFFAAPAVLSTGIVSASGILVSKNFLHCAKACGCEYTVFISSKLHFLFDIKFCLISNKISPFTFISSFCIKVSIASVTQPCKEFSIGTIASSTSLFSKAKIVSNIVLYSIFSSDFLQYSIHASYENVPFGPKYPTFILNFIPLLLS